jgi:2-polyprenyl-3-methyl-5-hydroxy-6-metoxy-1,4-benzoquinol methylase
MPRLNLARRIPVRNTRVVLRIPEILRICENRKVLHLGCADMPYTLQREEKLLHKQLMKVTGPHKLWGLDLSEEGVRILRTMGIDHVVQGDVEKIPKELQQEKFDIILAGEIIEHVANPGLFLSSLISIMNKTTELVLTTPNAFSFKGFLHSMLQEEKVHQDHNYYFSYYVLKQLLEKFDLRCKEIYYYQEIENTGLLKVFDKVISFVTWISPTWADGLIVRAVL